MTLDEAIKHAEEVAEKKFDNAVYIMDKMKSDIALKNAEECKQCAQEYRQLAEWLKDYKRLLEQEPILEKVNKMKSEIADSLEFWDYSPNNNPLARDMLETITNFWGDMRGDEV